MAAPKHCAKSCRVLKTARYVGGMRRASRVSETHSAGMKISRDAWLIVGMGNTTCQVLRTVRYVGGMRRAVRVSATHSVAYWPILVGTNFGISLAAMECIAALYATQ